MRVDLFTVIHKGIRRMLFELAGYAARCDLRSTTEVAWLVTRVGRAIGFLHEHGQHEDLHVVPALRTVDPELAAALAAEHRGLDVAAETVAQVAHALAAAEPDGREAAGARLVQGLNQLVALQLVHMGREETDINAALWAALDDAELAAIHGRIVGGIPTARQHEWMELVAPALSPVERALVIG